jgi:hypothetical protein
MESMQIMELLMTPFGCQQAFVLETSERAAHCIFGFAGAIADMLRHAQVKFICEPSGLFDGTACQVPRQTKRRVLRAALDSAWRVGCCG